MEFNYQKWDRSNFVSDKSVLIIHGISFVASVITTIVLLLVYAIGK